MSCLLAGLALATALEAAEPPRMQLLALSGLAAPVLDGYLDDPAWDRAPRATDFTQIRPTDGGPPSERTEVQVAYDESHVYVALRAFDSDVANLVAKGMIHGQTFFSDDRFEVRLDTFNDRRNAYYFQVNPNGIRREALVGNDYFIEEWDTVWHAEAAVHDWGWSAEIAIPLKSIAFDPAINSWGLNFSRVYPRRGEEMSWAARERSIAPAVSGYADGIEGLDQGLGIELVPSLALRYRDDAGGSGFDAEPSFTGFKYLTPFLTAGMTLNTDFSATEADERRVNLTRFSLFFPEKRDFFLRDASIFEFGSLDVNGRPFFSRRIGLAADGTPLDIEAGAKLSGRAGDWNLGALLIDQQPGQPFADDTLFVGRATRNLFAESELGVIATRGDPINAADNLLIGTDFTYRKSDFLGNRRLRANLWLQHTDTEGVTGDTNAYGLRLDYPNDRFDWEVDLRRLEQNFNPGLGFTNRRGVDQVDGEWRYRHRLDERFWQWLGVRAQFFRSDRIDGGLQSESVFFNLFEGLSSGNDFFTLFVGRETEGLEETFPIVAGIEVPAGRYASERYGFFFETGRQRPLAFTLEYVDGEFLDGRSRRLAPELEWRPSRYLLTSLTLVQDELDLADGSFTTRVVQGRLDIAFSPEWAWLNLVQTDNVSDTLGINSRLRFEPSAGWRFFLVFNQARDRGAGENRDLSVVLKAVINWRI